MTVLIISMSLVGLMLIGVIGYSIVIEKYKYRNSGGYEQE
jgi:preprotein translocase subunit Sss1